METLTVPDELRYVMVDGRGYTAPPKWKVFEDQDVVKIGPVLCSKVFLIILNIMFLGVAIGIIVASSWLDEPFIIFFGIAFIVMDLVVTPGLIFWYRHEFKKGPWLILERATGRLELGRLGKTFDITKDTVNFQECSGVGSVTGYHPFLASLYPLTLYPAFLALLSRSLSLRRLQMSILNIQASAIHCVNPRL